MITRSNSPGVWVPPPLCYALAILIGVLLDRRWPLTIVAGALTAAAGVTILVGGLALAFLSMGRFRQAKTSPFPMRPASALVTSGPYRYTRNPMYVSLALMTIAGALLLRTWWPVVMLLPTLGIVRQFVILPEERYLRPFRHRV
jgi:protein-S-isoprenylcysteine O-methyltransferase Ste14